ncbi:MAG: hypothetical protein VX911_11485 [Candidatus Latescibacterota bacterium]|nr:hypothetical protein [Candidatus Latescibacterota bacterium]
MTTTVSGGRGKRNPCADFVGDGIAGHLLKWVHFQQDTEGRDVGLFYFRDTEGRGFILAEKGNQSRPMSASGQAPSRTTCAGWQLSAAGAQDFETPEGIRVCHAMDFAG